MLSHKQPIRAAANEDAQTILDGLRRISRTLRAFSASTERTLGISGAQLFALETVARCGPLSICELADRTLTHQSSVSVVVKKLVERGLLLRHRSKADARRLEIAVSARGRLLLRSCRRTPQDQLVQAVIMMPAAEQRILSPLLSRLAATLDDAGAAAPMFYEEEK